MTRKIPHSNYSLRHCEMLVACVCVPREISIKEFIKLELSWGNEKKKKQTSRLISSHACLPRTGHILRQCGKEIYNTTIKNSTAHILTDWLNVINAISSMGTYFFYFFVLIQIMQTMNILLSFKTLQREHGILGSQNIFALFKKT